MYPFFQNNSHFFNKRINQMLAKLVSFIFQQPFSIFFSLWNGNLSTVQIKVIKNRVFTTFVAIESSFIELNVLDSPIFDTE